MLTSLMVVETPSPSRLKTELYWEDLAEALSGDPARKLYKFEVEHKAPVAEAKVQRELLKLARKAVARKRK